VLVRSARLDRGRLDDANFTRGSSGGVDVRLPNLRAAGAEREIVEGGIYGIVSGHLARCADGRVLDYIEVAIDLEALRREAIHHGRHHEAITVRVLDDIHAGESTNRAGTKNAKRVGVVGFITIRDHQRVGHECK